MYKMLNLIATPSGTVDTVGICKATSMPPSSNLDVVKWNQSSDKYINIDNAYWFTLPTPQIIKRDDSWTFSCWIYQKIVLGGNVPLFCFYTTSGGSGWEQDCARGLQLSDLTGEGNIIGSRIDRNRLQILANSRTPLNRWVHVAFCNDNGMLRLFIDGVLNDKKPNKLDMGLIDKLFLYPSYVYVDDVFVVYGKALYTTNFTPKSTYVCTEKHMYISEDKKVFLTR